MDDFNLALVPANDLESIQHAIDERLRMMSHLQNQVLQLQSHLNSLRPACRLPDEVLAEIFLECVKDCRAEYENAAWNDYGQQPYKWLPITHVCHKWREAALSHPRLWDWVVPLRPESTEAFIVRSGQRPLIVPQRRLPLYNHPVAGNRGPTVIRATSDMNTSLQLVFDQLYRVERIDLHSTCSTPEDPLPDAPLLRSLTIRDARAANASALEYFKTLPLPSLTAFHCWCSPNVLTPFLRDNLTSLTLSCGLINKDGLLDILQNMQMLTRLRVDKVEGVLPHAIPALPQPTRHVALPNLRYIHLTENREGRAAASLLQHLTLSDTATITVFAYQGLPQIEATEVLFEAIGDLGGDDVPLVLGISTPNDKLEFSIWRAPQNLETYRKQDTWGSPRIRFRSYVPPGRRTTCLEHFARSLAQRVARVGVVFVDSQITSREWHDAFDALPAVHQVYVHGEGAKHLSAGLRPGTVQPMLLHPILFPDLHTLVLEDVDWCTQTDPEVLCAHPCEVATVLAAAIGERGGIPHLVIRQGKRIDEVDVEHIATWGNINTLDWDGLIYN
ncbi:hypothetical protein EIP86_001659 [Pleurotus ostreatoroseus]|nr:hypothetical protein EIP86_001659 [Pleurotus ostreatoroseus]